MILRSLGVVVVTVFELDVELIVDAFVTEVVDVLVRDELVLVNVVVDAFAYMCS